MRVFGKPEYLNLYHKHFAPYLRGVNISAWDLEINPQRGLLSYAKVQFRRTV